MKIRENQRECIGNKSFSDFFHGDDWYLRVDIFQIWFFLEIFSQVTCAKFQNFSITFRKTRCHPTCLDSNILSFSHESYFSDKSLLDHCQRISRTESRRLERIFRRRCVFRPCYRRSTTGTYAARERNHFVW